jgi:hypothetical protein
MFFKLRGKAGNGIGGWLSPHAGCGQCGKLN